MQTRSRLTSDQIEQIRTLYWEESWTQPDLAKEFNCDQGHICRLVNYEYDGRPGMLAKKYAAAMKNITTPKASKSPGITYSHLNRLKNGKHPSAKLNWDKVAQIRGHYYFHNQTQQELAQKFKVAQCTIKHITTGDTWKTL